MEDQITLQQVFIFLVVILIFFGNILIGILKRLKMRQLKEAPLKKRPPKKKVLTPKYDFVKPAIREAQPEELELEIEPHYRAVPEHVDIPSPDLLKKKCVHRYCLGKRDLKKAIVWSEILAPPLGLRDNMENRF